LNLAAGDTLTVDQGAGAVAVANGMTITAAQIPTLRYTPAANAIGSARSTFTFTVNDAGSGTVAATMRVNVTAVNNPPVAEASSVTTNEDTPTTLAVPDFRFTDAEGDALASITLSDLNLAAGDTLTVDQGAGAVAVANGTTITAAQIPTLTYTPAANAIGSARSTFTFTVNDAGSGTVAATMSINVTAVNDAPVAVNQSVTSPAGNPVTVTLAAGDVDGDPLGFLIVNEPAYGELSGTAPNLTYTPGPNHPGSDSFTFKASDGLLESNVATVSVTVNAAAAGPHLAHGVVSVGSNWQTVTLPYTYSSMVVVATPNYDANSPPAVTRIRNAAGNSFEVRVQEAGPNPVASMNVHFVVMESGVYNQAGFRMEVVKFTSTVTDQDNSWKGEPRSYAQSYSNPVVLGQVMTYNDPGWSVFWASGSTRDAPPSNAALSVGKHVGEDPDVTRVDETIGYIVIETSTSGTAQIEGLRYVAAVGANTIGGMDYRPPYNYAYAAMPNSKAAVVSQAGMNGANGGWPILYGMDPITPTGGTLKLSIDEDQTADAERSHAYEQAAYLIIDPPAAYDSVAPSVSSKLADKEASSIVTSDGGPDAWRGWAALSGDFTPLSSNSASVERPSSGAADPVSIVSSQAPAAAGRQRRPHAAEPRGSRVAALDAAFSLLGDEDWRRPWRRQAADTEQSLPDALGEGFTRLAHERSQ
ncbi:MAG: tandem-95 repeat protein, partial [Pirellulales bacterium]|nr:tandem-95 repeat protein [Pirellulales bacterium]